MNCSWPLCCLHLWCLCQWQPCTSNGSVLKIGAISWSFFNDIYLNFNYSHNSTGIRVSNKQKGRRVCRQRENRILNRSKFMLNVLYRKRKCDNRTLKRGMTIEDVEIEIVLMIMMLFSNVFYLFCFDSSAPYTTRSGILEPYGSMHIKRKNILRVWIWKWWCYI